jgi:hypothetical protein
MVLLVASWIFEDSSIRWEFALPSFLGPRAEA